MAHPPTNPRPLLISFSGLDGAGKTTEIENLQAHLAAAGYSIARLAFWDDVVVLKGYRESFVHKAFGSEIGVGAPGKPVHRRDKNVRKWYLTLARHALYLFDALKLGFVLWSARRRGPDAIILDRYIYDEWANLPLRNPFTRAYVRLLRTVVPKPDIGYLLDADPEAAHARKPEYSVNFLHECRAAYYRLGRFLGTMTLIPPLELDSARQAVEAAAAELLRAQAADANPGIAPVRGRAA